MSVGAITSSLVSATGNVAASASSALGGFAAAMSAATGTTATSTPKASASNPFGQLGSDLQSFLVQLGGTSGSVKDTSAATASANSTAGLHSLGHSHHHGARDQQGSGDLTTDFANAAVN